jgi:hypothetical protein
MSCPNCPPLTARIWNFALAAARHARDGFRIVTRDELQQRLAACETCPLLVDGRCTHAACGCPISGDRSAYWSKLAWASEGCPDNRWPAAEPPG